MGEVAALAGNYAGLGIWGLLGALALVLIRTWPALKQMGIDNDKSLRTDLLKRVADLETELAAERRACDEKLLALRREMDAKYEGLMRQFLTAQMAWAQAIPPSRRSPEIDRMLGSLNEARRETEE
jgi:hypothetical protein